MKLTPSEVASVIGDAPPQKAAPVTPVAKAANELGDLDQMVRRHVETNARPGETYEGAFTRQMDESPDLYRSYQQKRDRIIAKHGIGGEATSRPFGQ